MSNNILTKNSFSKLASDIENIIIEGKNIANELVRKQLTLTYWEVGKRIKQENLTNNANYHNSIIADLSAKLSIEKTTLLRAVQLFDLHQNKDEIADLSWTHHRYLLGVKDPYLRIELTNKANQENWSSSKLALKGKQIKELQSTNSSNTSIVTRPTNSDYLYRAKVIDVVDGDTLLVNIDLGFLVNKEQRVRLNQIDAPEAKTKEGKMSSNYLRDLMASLNHVVIKTNKIDIYGRYLADVFYLEKDVNNKKSQNAIFANGVYLNEKLVQKGFAVPI